MGEDRCLTFVNDLELSIFLWRHLTKNYETRTLTLLKHIQPIERMEAAASQKSVWRLSESDIRPLFEQFLSSNEEVRATIASALSSIRIEVCDEEESGWLSELLDVTVNRRKPEDVWIKCNQKTKFHIDVLLCLISSTIDQADPFSATRLLSTLCPQVLPGLRKRAAATNLNIVQALLSYSMTARIHESGQDDAILAQHVDMLKQFDTTIDDMHEKLHEYTDPHRSISTMLTAATNFLLSTPAFANEVAGIRKAQSLIQSQLKQLDSNQKNIYLTIPCGNEDAPEFVTRRDRVCRALLDRFTALQISGESAINLAMTPAFKTPQVAEASQVSSTPTRTVEGDDDCETPKRENIEGDDKTISWFTCNTTPTPRREPTMYEELLDEEKENIGPTKKIVDEDEDSENVQSNKGTRTPLGEQTTPMRVRPIGGLRLRTSNTDNRSVLGEKKSSTTTENKSRRRSKGAEGEAKKAKSLPTSQPSIRSFFGAKC